MSVAYRVQRPCEWLVARGSWGVCVRAVAGARRLQGSCARREGVHAWKIRPRSIVLELSQIPCFIAFLAQFATE